MSSPSMVHRSGNGLIVRSVVSGDRLYGSSDSEEDGAPAADDEEDSSNNKAMEQPVVEEELPQCKVKRSYTCNSCNYYTQNPRDHLHHLRNVHNEKIRIYECPQCLYASKHSQKLQRHIHMVHVVGKKKELIKAKAKKHYDELSETCSLETASESSLMKSPDREPENCEASAQEELIPTVILSENEAGANGDESYKCRECNFASPDENLVACHEQVIHLKKKFYRCSKCDYATHMKARFTKHVKYHSMPMIKCEMCDFQTPYKWNLDRHNKNHFADGAFKCLKCNFTADIKQSLTVHEMNHHVPPLTHNGQHVVNTGKRRCKVGASDTLQQMTEVAADAKRETTPEIGSLEMTPETGSLEMTNGDDPRLSPLQDVTREIHVPKISQKVEMAKSSRATSANGKLNSKDVIMTKTGTVYVKKYQCRVCPYKAAWESEMNRHEARVHGLEPIFRKKIPRSADAADDNPSSNNCVTPVTVSRPVPNLIPIQSTASLPPPPSEKSTTSGDIDHGSYFKHNYGPDSVSTSLGESGSRSKKKEGDSFKKKNATFFDRLKEKLVIGASDSCNLLCNVCGYKSKCLSESVLHQKVHEDDVDLLFSGPMITEADLSSTRCQHCRQRCKTSSDLFQHLQTCPGVQRGRTPQGTKLESIIDRQTSQNLNIDSPGFVWNHFLDDTCDKNQTVISNEVSLVGYEVTPGIGFIHNKKGNSKAPDIEAAVPPTDASKYSPKKVYKCPRCAFWATTASRFHVHFVGHLNKKPFECSVCQYRSNWRWDITKHIRLKKIRDSDHEKGKVLMTDETGRRNYTKYNKYLTEMKIYVPENEETDSSEYSTKYVPADPPSSATNSVDGSSSGEMVPPTDVGNNSGLTDHPVLHSSVDENNKRPLELGDGKNTVGKKKIKTETKKTSFRCKRCSFRDCDKLVVMNHVRTNHYNSSNQTSATCGDSNINSGSSCNDTTTVPSQYCDDKTNIDKSDRLRSGDGNFQKPDASSSDIKNNEQFEKTDKNVEVSNSAELLENVNNFEDQSSDSADVSNIDPESNGNIDFNIDHCGTNDKDCFGIDSTDYKIPAVERLNTVYCADINFGQLENDYKSADVCNNKVSGAKALDKNDIDCFTDESSDEEKMVKGCTISILESIKNFMEESDDDDETRSIDKTVSTIENSSDIDKVTETADGIDTGENVNLDMEENSIFDANECKKDNFIDENSGANIISENASVCENSSLEEQCCDAEGDENNSDVESNSDSSSTDTSDSNSSDSDDRTDDDNEEIERIDNNVVTKSSAEENSSDNVDGDNDDTDDSSHLSHAEECDLDYRTVDFGLDETECSMNVSEMNIEKVGAKKTNKKSLIITLPKGNNTVHKKFKCDGCPYQTNTKSQYLYHEQFHRTENAAFKCTVCSYGVTKRHLLHQHLRLHGISKFPADGLVDKVIHETEESPIVATDLCKLETYTFTEPPLVWVYRLDVFCKMFACRTCPTVHVCQSSTVEHEKCHSKCPELLSCAECDFTSEDSKMLRSHYSAHSDPTVKIYSLVDKSQSDESQIIDLIASVKNETAAVEIPVDNDPVSIETSISQNVFEPEDATSITSSALTESVPSQNPEDKTTDCCPRCPARFSSVGDVETHMKFHDADLLLKCESCTYSTNVRRHLEAHLKLHRPVSEEKTSECHSTVSTDSLEETSLVSNSVNENADCSVANSPQPSEPEANTTPPNYEMYDVPDSPPVTQLQHRHPCYKCPAKFAKRSILEYHLTLHGSNGQYKCRECDYAVNSYGNIVKHECVHVLPPRDKKRRKLSQKKQIVDEDHLPASVDFSATIAEESSMQSSPQIFVPEFKIPEVPQSFVQKSPKTVGSPRVNKKILKRYKCEKCPCAFARRESYIAHFALHGAKQRFTCEKCDFSVKAYTNYVQHIRRHVNDPSNDVVPHDFEPTEGSDIRPSTPPPYPQNLSESLAGSQPMQSSDNAIQPMLMSESPQKAGKSLANWTSPLKQRKVEDTTSPPEPAHRCSYCPYRSNRRDLVENHLKCHLTSNGPYVCDYCNYSVGQVRFLKEHKKLHFNQMKGVKVSSYMKCDKLELWAQYEDTKMEKTLIFRDNGTSVKDGRYLPLPDIQNSADETKPKIYINLKTGDRETSAAIQNEDKETSPLRGFSNSDKNDAIVHNTDEISPLRGFTDDGKNGTEISSYHSKKNLFDVNIGNETQNILRPSVIKINKTENRIVDIYGDQKSENCERKTGTVNKYEIVEKCDKTKEMSGNANSEEMKFCAVFQKHTEGSVAQNETAESNILQRNVEKRVLRDRHDDTDVNESVNIRQSHVKNVQRNKSGNARKSKLRANISMFKKVLSNLSADLLDSNSNSSSQSSSSSSTSSTSSSTSTSTSTSSSSSALSSTSGASTTSSTSTSYEESSYDSASSSSHISHM